MTLKHCWFRRYRSGAVILPDVNADPDVLPPSAAIVAPARDAHTARIDAGWQPIDGYWWRRIGITWLYEPMTDPELATHRQLTRGDR